MRGAKPKLVIEGVAYVCMTTPTHHLGDKQLVSCCEPREEYGCKCTIPHEELFKDSLFFENNRPEVTKKTLIL